MRTSHRTLQAENRGRFTDNLSGRGVGVSQSLLRSRPTTPWAVILRIQKLRLPNPRHLRLLGAVSC